MKIYVGRMVLLNEQSKMMREIDVQAELSREIEVYAKSHDTEDNSMGVYTPAEFEDAFNRGDFSKAQYWVKVY